jgi:ceramide glucosyltransferase
MYPYASYEYLVISDSNVKVKSNYLRQMIQEMYSPEIGLVTSTIRGTDTTGISSLYENVHLNTFVAGNVFAVKRFFGIPITIGKSMLFRRETLERLGGFGALAHYLAEDYILGQKILAMGLKISISGNCVDAVNSGWKFSQFVNRQLRWATMRRHINVWHYIVEILSNPILFALLFLIKNQSLYGLEFFLSVYLFKVFLDFIAARSMNSGEPWHHYFLTPIKDLIVAGIWVIPFFNYTVNWRGNYFIIGASSRLVRLEAFQSIAFNWTLGNAYYAAFKDYRAISNLTLIQRFFWFTSLAGKSLICGTRKVITRLGGV